MYCRNCGSETDGAKFCPNCGAQQTAEAPPQPSAAQYQTYNNVYAAPPRNVPDMTVGDWMITILITFIPLVGFIFLIVWAASSPGDKASRKTWAIANLIWTGIIVVIYIMIMVIFVAVGSSK